MKKKTIVFSCLAVLFLLSAFSGFSGGLVSGGIGCLVICGVFAFLAFRSSKAVAETNRETLQTFNRLPPPNKNSFSRPAPDNAVNSDTAETPAAAPVPSSPAPHITETAPFTPSVSTKERTTTPPSTVSDVPDVTKQFEYLEIKVAGVTFKNDKGPTRQTLLKKIKQRSAPFDEYLEISLNQYDFEGELAYSVCVNDRQIGSVPKSQVQYLHDNLERFVAITGINIYGGYRDENGYFKSYGAAITIKFRLSDNNS